MNKHIIGRISPVEPWPAEPVLWKVRVHWFLLGVTFTLVALFIVAGVVSK
jgi:hypothetical protein